jgi:hypothetical protein
LLDELLDEFEFDESPPVLPFLAFLPFFALKATCSAWSSPIVTGAFGAGAKMPACAAIGASAVPASVAAVIRVLKSFIGASSAVRAMPRFHT